MNTRNARPEFVPAGGLPAAIKSLGCNHYSVVKVVFLLLKRYPRRVFFSALRSALAYPQTGLEMPVDLWMLGHPRTGKDED